MDLATLRAQRAHLHRQKRSLAWAYMLAYRSNEDATEILAELQRLSCDILALDLLIGEAETIVLKAALVAEAEHIVNWARMNNRLRG